MKTIPPLTPKDIARFWAKVNKTDDACWEWTACTGRAGYGNFTIRHTVYLAHRVAYFLQTGQQPTNDVCHTCDNPPCMRGDHLFDGSHAENMADMAQKGRANPPTGDRHNSRTKPHTVPRGDRHASRTKPWAIARGEKIWTCRLTPEQVLDIKQRYKPRVVTQDQLAAEYNVARSTIGYVVRGDNWAWLTAQEPIDSSLSIADLLDSASA